MKGKRKRIEADTQDTIILETKKKKYAKKSQIINLFNKYKEDDAHIGPDGIIKFCNDIGVKPEDVRMLILAYEIKAEAMGIFKKDEFIEGLKKLGVDSTKKITLCLDELMNNLKQHSYLKNLFSYAYKFVCKGTNSRIITLDLAIEIIQMLLNGNCHTKDFCKYLNYLMENDSQKGLNFDQWIMYFEFATSVSSDFKGYDPNDAWPLIIDEYVEFVKEEQSKV